MEHEPELEPEMPAMYKAEVGVATVAIVAMVAIVATGHVVKLRKSTNNKNKRRAWQTSGGA